jgi:hypothetical protein
MMITAEQILKNSSDILLGMKELLNENDRLRFELDQARAWSAAWKKYAKSHSDIGELDRTIDCLHLRAELAQAHAEIERKDNALRTLDKLDWEHSDIGKSCPGIPLIIERALSPLPERKAE